MRNIARKIRFDSTVPFFMVTAALCSMPKRLLSSVLPVILVMSSSIHSIVQSSSQINTVYTFEKAVKMLKYNTSFRPLSSRVGYHFPPSLFFCGLSSVSVDIIPYFDYNSPSSQDCWLAYTGGIYPA